METLHDEAHFSIPESMQRVVGSSDVSQHREVIALLVLENRIVRRDQVLAHAANKDSPRAISHESADHLGVIGGVKRIGSHVSQPLIKRVQR